MEIYVEVVTDPEAERAKLEKQKQQIIDAKRAVEAKLANKDFVTKAKPKVVAAAKDKLAQLIEQLKTVEKHLSEL
jgi:valyl-tRNA synthetase